MKLSAGQEQALICISELQKSHPNGGGIGIISGFAGTGKTTLIRVLAEEHENNLLVATPTGKAAVRVREVSGAESHTLHSWMYSPNEDERTGIIEWGLKELSEIRTPGCGFLLIDEASMVTYDVFVDVYKMCKALYLNLILIGDGFQLPPVETDPKKRDFSVFNPAMPHNFRVNLTEIHRQALDSPIIRASMEIRRGGWTGEALSSLPIVLESQLLDASKLAWENEGATICYTNAMRHQINRGVRQRLGYGEAQLELHEPILITQNNYDLEIYNGEILNIEGELTPINVDPIAVRDAHKNAAVYVNFIGTTVDTPLKGRHQVCLADREVFGTLGEVGSHCVRRSARHLRDEMYGRTPEGRVMGPSYLQANLGYALTCHKSQGSEFPEVIVVIENSLRMNTEDGKRWCYTALTRAKKKISICWR